MNFTERYASKPTVSVIESLTPRIYISQDALVKMYHFVQECAQEIGWLGTVEQKGRNYLIKDVFLFDQEVHATTTEITPEGLSSFAEELLAKPEGLMIWNSMRMWGHSHVNMGITPSGQDDSQMNEFRNTGHDSFIRLIANKKGDLKVDLYDYLNGVKFLDVPWEAELTGKDVEIQQQIQQLQTLLQQHHEEKLKVALQPIKDEMLAKVKQKTYATRANTWGTGGAGRSYENEYGRYVGNTWVRWTDAERAANAASKVAQTAIGFHNDYDIYGFDQDEKPTGSIASTSFYTEDELLEIASCRSVSQTQDLIDEFGYGSLTFDEARSLQKQASELVFGKL